MKTLILISLSIFLSSCSLRYYSPDDAKMMTFTKKNQVQVSGSTGIVNSAFDVQAGWSPIKHLRLSGSYFLRAANNSGDSFNDSRRSGNGKLWTGEIGGYYFFKNKKYDERKDEGDPSIGLLLDFQQGLGFGKIKTDYSDVFENQVSGIITTNEGNSTITLTKNFQQIGIHWIDEYFEFGIAHRFGKLHYNEAILSGEISGDVRSSIGMLEENNIFRINETTLRLAICISGVKLFGHISFLGNNDQLIRQGTYTNNFGGGLLMELDHFFWKKSKKGKKK